MMSDYKRLFSYVYFYDREIKEKNAGFLKVEIRNGQCRAQVSVRGGFLNRAPGWGVYGFKREEDGLYLWPLGQLTLRPGQGEWTGQMARDRFLGAAGCLEDVAGVLLCAGAEAGGYIADLAKWSGDRALCATVWDDLPLFAPREILHAAGIGEDDVTELPVAEAAGVEQQEWEILRDLLEEREVETFMTGREAEPVKMPEPAQIIKKNMKPEQPKPEGPVESEQRSLSFEPIKGPEPVETSRKDIIPEPSQTAEPVKPTEQMVFPQLSGESAPVKPAEETMFLEPDKGTWQAEPTKESIAPGQTEPAEENTAPKQTESVEETEDLERRRAMRMGREDKMGCPCPGQCIWRDRYREPPGSIWEGLSRQYPKLLLNGISSGWEILKIMPGDIGRLPRENWVYGNNSFLLHGYYRYHHLILACYRGAGYEQYYLGVPGPGHGRERVMASMFGFTNYLPAGKYGYWYTPINLGNN